MSETKNLANAISAFSQKLKRFNNAALNERIKAPSKDSFLQEQILEREERLRKNVVSTYKIYKSPFEALGKNSERAAGIDRDEETLLEAYKLYEQVMDLNESLDKNTSSVRTTFISKLELSSPLAQKAIYTDGGLFIYLVAWLCFEKQCTKYLPHFVEKEKTRTLCFEEASLHSFDSHDKEIFNIIKQEFYS